MEHGEQWLTCAFEDCAYCLLRRVPAGTSFTNYVCVGGTDEDGFAFGKCVWCCSRLPPYTQEEPVVEMFQSRNNVCDWSNIAIKSPRTDVFSIGRDACFRTASNQTSEALHGVDVEEISGLTNDDVDDLLSFSEKWFGYEEMKENESSPEIDEVESLLCFMKDYEQKISEERKRKNPTPWEPVEEKVIRNVRFRYYKPLAYEKRVYGDRVSIDEFLSTIF